MNSRDCLGVICTCLLALAAFGCVATGGGTVGDGSLPVTVLRTGQHCQSDTEGWRATWIASPEALREWVSACRSNVIEPLQGNMPSVDFERFGVLAVEMGWRNTAGYGFDAAGVEGEVAGRTATVAVKYHRPDPGAVTAQVITSPWMLVQMPLAGYDSIRVVDQQDARPLLQIERP